METIQIVLDKQLLAAADRAARRSKRSRSALIRDALRQHLRNLHIRELEKRDHRGHTRRLKSSRTSNAWEAEAAWPKISSRRRTAPPSFRAEEAAAFSFHVRSREDEGGDQC